MLEIVNTDNINQCPINISLWEGTIDQLEAKK